MLHLQRRKEKTDKNMDYISVPCHIKTFPTKVSQHIASKASSESIGSSAAGMSDMKRRTGLLIFMFWVVVPTLDQYSDLAILTSLYTGPDPGMEVRGGRARVVHIIHITAIFFVQRFPFLIISSTMEH